MEKRKNNLFLFQLCNFQIFLKTFLNKNIFIRIDSEKILENVEKKKFPKNNFWKRESTTTYNSLSFNLNRVTIYFMYIVNKLSRRHYRFQMLLINSTPQYVLSQQKFFQIHHSINRLLLIL